jgi:hypothetical protein
MKIDHKAPQNDPTRFSGIRYTQVFEKRNVRVWGSDCLCIPIGLARAYEHTRAYGPAREAAVESSSEHTVDTLCVKPENRTCTLERS